MPTATVATVSVTTTDRAVSAAWQGRLDALADHSLGGRAFCRQLAAATDVWIEALAASAREQHPRRAEFALLAVGGFGRGELSPQSDLDLLLVHDSKSARPRGGGVGDLVSGLGRRTQARARRAQRRRADRARQARPRHGDGAAHGAPHRRRRQAERAGHRDRAGELEEAQQAVARAAPAERPRAPGAAPARSPTSSSPTSRTATAASATRSRCGGRNAAGWRCRPRTTPPSTSATRCWSTLASRCIARPAARATRCGSRTRTPPRRRPARRTPTR